MPPSKWGLGFSFFVFRCPQLVKSGLAKTTMSFLPIFAKRLLRGIKSQYVTFLIFIVIKLLSVAVFIK